MNIRAGNFFYDRAEKLLKELISIPSLSGEERGCADALSDYLLEKGVNVIRTGNNIIALSNSFDQGRKTVLLNSHIDTVAPSESYTFDPFVPREDGDRIGGLGSNDAKASVVSLTETFLFFEENDYLDINLILILSAEEENSGERGISLALSVSPQIDCAVVGEPTGMKMAVAEKGLIVVDAVAKGKSGHAARGEGVNAIDIAIEDIMWLNSYDFQKKSPLTGNIRCTVTGINAGKQHNVIPDRCSFMIDIRTNEMYLNEEIMDILSTNMKSELKARSLKHKSSSVPQNHPLIKCAEKLGVKTFVSPTTSDWMRLNFPAIKMGPGDSSRSHSADEFILKGELSDGIERYIDFISNLKL